MCLVNIFSSIVTDTPFCSQIEVIVLINSDGNSYRRRAIGHYFTNLKKNIYLTPALLHLELIPKVLIHFCTQYWVEKRQEVRVFTSRHNTSRTVVSVS